MLLVFSFSAYTRQPHPMLPMLPMLPVLPVLLLLLLLLSMACNHRHRCCCWCCFCCWRKPHPHSVVVGSESAPVCHSRQRATCNRHTAKQHAACRLPHAAPPAPCCLLAADLHTKPAFVRLPPPADRWRRLFVLLSCCTRAWPQSQRGSAATRATQMWPTLPIILI